MKESRFLGELVEVSPSALTPGGAFIGKIEHGPEELVGKKVFIMGAAPGERVRARITADEKKLAHAELIEVLTPSSDRVDAPCPYVKDCGGCQLQHLTLEAQRAAKRSMIDDFFRIHVGVQPANGTEVAQGELPALHYRRRISLHLNKAGELGFYRRNSGDVVPIRECLISQPVLNRALATLLPHTNALCAWCAGVVLEEFRGKPVYIFKSDPEGREIDAAERAFVQEHFENFKITRRERVDAWRCGFADVDESEFLSLSHFSQINEEGNRVLVEWVTRLVSGTEITELYAGSGNFSLPLAERGCRVQAVEIDQALIQYGRARAERAGVAHRLIFHHASAEQYLKRDIAADTLLLDPPRSGARAVAQNIRADKVPEIVYVSCSLPTLTRDLKDLRARGYFIERCVLVDMFPQTDHVETITLLKRN